MKIHVVRHFPAVKNVEVEKMLGATKGGALRPLDIQKAARLAPIFRAKLEAEKPKFTLLGHSPTIRAAATMLITTVGIADGAPVVEVPELYWTDENIAGTMADFKAHDVDVSKWSAEGLAALDRLGQTGADGICRVLDEGKVTQGDVFFVGHGPLTLAVAYRLAGTPEAKQFCLGCVAKEGSRFVVDGDKVAFVPFE
ncbi:MAG: hypothetical protein HYV67_02595 [Candidatus Taylorbacteria bacterium]|nr:hypothetical protein [Candidatus Taylorbacteria bacterium]